MVLARDVERDGPSLPGARGRLSRWLTVALVSLLAALLVEVLLEAWVQVLLSETTVDAAGQVVADLPTWPKAVKNALYLTLLATAGLKVAVEGRWRDFTSAADIALVALGATLVIAGLVNGSPVGLIAEAGYVYLRGVIVFYAWRAAAPSPRQIRWVLTPVAVLAAIDAAIAIAQTLVGRPGYTALGWYNLTWARINRAHALLDHPNHLGHFLALTMLGLLAWFVVRRTVRWQWWLAFTLLAVALSATQSRESVLGFVAAAAVIAVLRRGRLRAVAAATALVLAFAAAQVGFSPSNRAELQRRLIGVSSALNLPSGAEEDDFCVAGNAGCDAERGIPQREVRVLYAQQGVRLWLDRPFLGYGVGQFGGIVAYQHDPRWYTDPRFGPDGFELYGSNEKQVDSFWLHLLVETGLLGVLAYLGWLALLIAPVVRAARSARDRVHPYGLWAPAALTFAVLVACLAPSLEDPLFPALLFTVLGIAWVSLRHDNLTDTGERSARRTHEEKIEGWRP